MLMYDKISSITFAEIVGILALTIPTCLIVNKCICPKISKLCKKDNIKSEMKEEDIIKTKIRSENLRPGPPFIQSHIYHNRRTERAKSAYTNAWEIINHNLDNGNRQFEFSLEDEDDLHILNVVKKLVIEELQIDGYNVKIYINKTPTEKLQHIFNVLLD